MVAYVGNNLARFAQRRKFALMTDTFFDVHHLIQKHNLHGFRKERPRQSRDDAVYSRNQHGLADRAYILDRVFEQGNAGVRGPENRGESRIDFDRCELRLRVQLSQYIFGENASSRTVFENRIRARQACLLHHHSGEIRRTGHK
jgi:hypothetical protein